MAEEELANWPALYQCSFARSSAFGAKLADVLVPVHRTSVSMRLAS